MSEARPVVCDRCGHVKDSMWWEAGLCNECFLGGRVVITECLLGRSRRHYAGVTHVT